MGHKYLLRRGRTYYFRWRIPADLRPTLGMTELKHSLRTDNSLRARLRAKPFVVAVSDIQSVRAAYLSLELDASDYVNAIRECWTGISSMVRKRRKKRNHELRVGYIETFDMRGVPVKFDTGDDDRDLALYAKAQAMGLLGNAQAQAGEVVQSGKEPGMLFSELYMDI